jgi:hypothetical protein
MSMFGLGNLFGNSAPISHGAGGPQPVATGNPAAPGTQQVADPAASQQVAAKDDSPLANLPNIFDTIKDAQGNAVAMPADPTAADIFNFDPVKTADSARKLDFTKGLDPALFQTALGGGENAAAALMQLINHAAGNALAASITSSGKFINEGIKTNNDRFKELLPRQIKQVQLDQTQTANPLLQHEAVQPLVTALKQMAFARDPNADPSDVTAKIEQYITGLSTAVAGSTPAAIAAASAKAGEEQDWSAFLGGN